MTEQALPAAGLTLVFATRDVHARDRLDYWREQATRVTVAHEFNSRVGRAFDGRISAGTLGTLPLALIETDACTVRRTERYINGGAEDDLMLSLLISGSVVMHQDGRDVIARSSDMFLLDPRRPFALEISPDLRALLIKVPRWELQARLGEISALTARPVSSSRPEAALASSFLAMLADRAGAIGEPAAGKVAQQALDLVALAFGPVIHGGRKLLSSSRTTTLLRLKSTIEARLHDPALKPQIAASETGISVRYANALLAEEGTSLERFIMCRRLQLCRQALESPAHAHRAVSDIAYSFGFSDVSHFTRRFRANFGCSPSECRYRVASLPR